MRGVAVAVGSTVVVVVTGVRPTAAAKSDDTVVAMRAGWLVLLDGFEALDVCVVRVNSSDRRGGVVRTRPLEASELKHSF